MKEARLKDFPLYTVREDGKIFNLRSGRVIKEQVSTVSGKFIVKLSVTTPKPGQKRENGSVKVEELVARTFLPKPKDNAFLYHKNDNESDSSVSNLAWFYPFEEPELQSVTYELPIQDEDNEENLIKYRPELLKETVFENENENEKLEEEEEQDIDEEMYDLKKEQDVFVEEDKDVQLIKDKLPAHDPIFKKFIDTDVEFNLNNVIQMNGKLWKTAKYKHYPLYTYLISEDMELYSKTTQKIVATGLETYDFKILGIKKSISLKDILASAFLKIPNKALFAVHKNWNPNFKKNRYLGQSNNYRNLIWLTSEDVKKVDGTNGKVLISNRGDLYFKNASTYCMYVDKCNKSGLRFCSYNKSLECNIKLSILTALAFVNRENETYKYLLYRDNNSRNDDYRNLVWVNTLEGRHSDGIYYYNIPSFPGYVLSETNIPYSFKSGTFKKLKLRRNFDGYLILSLYKNGKQKILRFGRVVAATRNVDFNPCLHVDHTDRRRDNDVPENLRSVTIRDNILNRVMKNGKNIMRIDTSGNITVYGNATEAALAMGGNYNKEAIQMCAWENNKLDNGKVKSGEYIWKYTEKYEKYKCKPGEYFVMLYGNFQGITLEYENYMASNFGTFLNIKKGYAMKFSNGQYPLIHFRKNGKNYVESVHVLLALLFVPGRTEESCFVNHLNEKKGDFKIENLQWCTLSENNKYSSYKKSLPVKKICMQTGKVISVHDSRVDGAKSCGKVDGGYINLVCKGEAYSAFEFFWQDIPFDEISNYPELTLNKRKEMFPE